VGYSVLPKNIQVLIEALSELPSIGPKSAERLAFYMLKKGDNAGLGRAITDLQAGIQLCSRCRNYTTEPTCPVCADPARDHQVICVVSQPLDVAAVEKTGLFRGVYHVLHGAISPIDGVGPEDLEIDGLLSRLEREAPTELIIATNPNLEGETTALFIVKKLEGVDIKITKLAHGLPMGADLEYADQLTLGRALAGRTSF
jgi:recombination protein RecR